MKRVYLFLALMIIMPALAYPQTAGLEFSYGTATYSMSDLHKFTDAYIRASGAEYTQLKDLPSGAYFGAAFVVGIGRFETGLDYHQYNTQSKMEGIENGRPVHYNHLLDGYSFGFFGKHPVYYSDKFQFKAGLRITVNATIANISNNELNPGDFITDEYQAVSIGASPFVEPVYYFRKWLYAGIRGGYAYDSGGTLYVRDNNDIKYRDLDGNVIKMNWSGLRAELFIGLRMNNN